MAIILQTSSKTSADEWETSAASEGEWKTSAAELRWVKDKWETRTDEWWRMRDECYSIIDESGVSYCFYFGKKHVMLVITS